MSKKKQKGEETFDKIPYDCWTAIVSFFDKHNEFLSLNLVVKGLYEYIQNIANKSCNFDFRMKEIPEFQKIGNLTKIVQSLEVIDNGCRKVHRLKSGCRTPFFIQRNGPVNERSEGYEIPFEKNFLEKSGCSNVKSFLEKLFVEFSCLLHFKVEINDITWSSEFEKKGVVCDFVFDKFSFESLQFGSKLQTFSFTTPFDNIKVTSSSFPNLKKLEVVSMVFRMHPSNYTNLDIDWDGFKHLEVVKIGGYNIKKCILSLCNSSQMNENLVDLSINDCYNYSRMIRLGYHKFLKLKSLELIDASNWSNDGERLPPKIETLSVKWRESYYHLKFMFPIQNFMNLKHIQIWHDSPTYELETGSMLFRDLPSLISLNCRYLTHQPISLLNTPQLSDITMNHCCDLLVHKDDAEGTGGKFRNIRIEGLISKDYFDQFIMMLETEKSQNLESFWFKQNIEGFDVDENCAKFDEYIEKGREILFFDFVNLPKIENIHIRKPSEADFDSGDEFVNYEVFTRIRRISNCPKLRRLEISLNEGIQISQLNHELEAIDIEICDSRDTFRSLNGFFQTIAENCVENEDFGVRNFVMRVTGSFLFGRGELEIPNILFDRSSLFIVTKKSIRMMEHLFGKKNELFVNQGSQEELELVEVEPDVWNSVISGEGEEDEYLVVLEIRREEDE